MASDRITAAHIALAESTAKYFHRAVRLNGESFVTLTDAAPEWLSAAIEAAHGRMLPNDTKYEMCRDALVYIAEVWPESADAIDVGQEFADGAVSNSNAERIEWLSSHLQRAAYVDEEMEERGVADDLFTMLGNGWYREAREVFGYMWDALDAEVSAAEEREEEEPDEETSMLAARIRFHGYVNSDEKMSAEESLRLARLEMGDK